MPDELDTLLASVPRVSRARTRPRRDVAYDRNEPSDSDWNISRAGEVKDFYKQTFGRDLPVSVMGQGQVHNREGYDHRNAIDARLNPASPEGQKLIGYLREKNIPFLAFDRPVRSASGKVVATGPHIHIGSPSHSTTARYAIGTTVLPQPQDGDALDSVIDSVPSVHPKDEAGKDELDKLLADVPQSEKWGFPSTSSRVLDDPHTGEPDAVDLTDFQGKPLSVRPIDFPAGVERSDSEKIASSAQDMGSWRENSDYQQPVNSGFGVSDTFMVKVPGDPRKYPTEDEIRDAVINAVPDLAKANEKYRVETGRSIGNLVNLDMATVRRSFNPESKSYEIAVNGTNRLARVASAYLSGGMQAAQDENRRLQIEMADEAAALKKDAATPRTWGDTGRAALADIGLSTAQLTHNLGTAADASLMQDRYSPAYEQLQQKERREQAAIDTARSSIPEETGTGRTIARTVGAGIGEAAPYVAAGAFGAPVVALTQNLNRGLPQATKQGLIAAATVGVGQGLGQVTNAMNPIARQAITRLGMGGTMAGASALGGERDPKKLFSASVIGAAFPIGKASGERGINPLGDAFERAGRNSVEALRTGETNYIRVPEGEPVPSLPKGFTRTRVKDGSYVLHSKAVPAEKVRAFARTNTLDVLNMTAGGESVIPELRAPDSELNALYAELAVPKDRPGFRRTVGDAINAFKSAKSSGDVSALLRQGLMFISEPRAWYRGMKEGVKALNTENYLDTVDAIRRHPAFEWANESGLYLATQGGGREEAFPSQMVGKLPIIKQSEQSFNAALDTMRLETFAKYAREFALNDMHPETHAKAFEDLAVRINSMSGRGDLGRLNGYAETLNVPIFSPRLIKARLDILNPLTYMRMDPAVRKIALTQTAKVVAAVASSLMLAKASGMDVETDPESADFLKIKSGDTRFDITGGNARYLRTAFRLVKYVGRLGVDGVNVRDDSAVALTEARKNLSPLPSYLVNAWLGKDVTGEDFRAGRDTLRLITPFFLDDLTDAFESEGLTGTVKALPSAVGVGVETHNDTERILQGHTSRDRFINRKLKEKVDSDPQLKQITAELGRLEFTVGKARRMPDESEEEYSGRLQEQEPQLTSALTDLIRSPEYEKMTDVEKREAIRYVEREIRGAER